MGSPPAQVWCCEGEMMNEPSGPPELRFVFEANRASVQLYTKLDDLGHELDLSPIEVLALVALTLHECSIGELADLLGRRRNGASVLVDRLAERGLVVRRREGTDRRVVQVELTDDGRERASSLLPQVVADLRAWMSPLTPSELRQLLDMTARLT